MKQLYCSRRKEGDQYPEYNLYEFTINGCMYVRKYCSNSLRECLLMKKVSEVVNTPKIVSKVGMHSEYYDMIKINGEHRDLNINEFNKFEGQIKAMHKIGVAHGDIHSKNILIQDGEVYLIDFEHAVDKSLNIREFLKKRKEDIKALKTLETLITDLRGKTFVSKLNHR